MKIKYDEEMDAIFFILSNHKIIESEEISSGVIIDYDSNDEVAAVEVLNFRSRKEGFDVPITMEIAS